MQVTDVFKPLSTSCTVVTPKRNPESTLLAVAILPLLLFSVRNFLSCFIACRQVAAKYHSLHSGIGGRLVIRTHLLVLDLSNTLCCKCLES